jgi:glycosyltransferase involved in cell wall biosynthesis
MNAGVSDAIFEIVRKFSDDSHLLLFDFHSDSPLDVEGVKKHFQNHEFIWKGNPIFKLFSFVKMVREIQPDVIHLHSSKAGFIGRLVQFDVPIVYSPHNFSFEKQDIPIIARKFFYFIELFLSRRTDAFITNWPVEFETVSQFSTQVKKYFVPLVRYDFSNSFNSTLDYSFKYDCVGIGRLTAAKDPKFFQEIHSLIPSRKFVWIGCHEKSDKTDFFKGDLEVYPWTPKEDLFEIIKESKLLLITSRWESGPLTLFQALEMGTPVVARSQKYTDLLGISGGASSTDLACQCENIIMDMEYRADLLHFQRKRVELVFKTYLVNSELVSYSHINKSRARK